MRELAVLPLILAVAAGAVACSRPWDAARTVVTAAALGVREADAQVVRAYEDSACETTEDLEELRRCVRQLREATEALQAARAAVLEGESAVDLWEQGGTEPSSWSGWLESGGQALARLVAVLEAAGVNVPEALQDGAAALDAYLEGRRSEP
jgi:hypothetical protein